MNVGEVWQGTYIMPPRLGLGNSQPYFRNLEIA